LSSVEVSNLTKTLFVGTRSTPQNNVFQVIPRKCRALSNKVNFFVCPTNVFCEGLCCLICTIYYIPSVHNNISIVI